MPLHERRALGWLFLAMWLLFAASSSGTLPADPAARFLAAEQLVGRGRLDLDQATLNTVEHQGRHYVVFFPGQGLIFLPLAAAGVLARAVLGPGGLNMPGVPVDFAVRFAAAVFLMPAFGALAVVGHVRVLRLLGAGLRPALAGGLILALATPLWIYSALSSEEVILAFCAVWALWALLDARRLAGEPAATDAQTAHRARQFTNRLGLAEVLLMLGLAHRATFLAVWAGVALVAASVAVAAARGPGRRLIDWRRALAWESVALAILGLVLLHNHLRFGSPFDTGYARFYEPFGGVFATPLGQGLLGHLASPGKSIFLYTPWLVIALAALCHRPVRQALGPVTWALPVIVAVHLWFYARFTFWGGDVCWGVRFHVCLMPLLLLPAGMWLHLHWPDGAAGATSAPGASPGSRGSVRRRVPWATWPVLAASVAVQVLGLSLNWGLEHFQHPENYRGDAARGLNLIPEEAAWTWSGSQLRLRAVNLADKLAGRPLVDPSLPPATQAAYSSWNLFPFRAAQLVPSRPVRWALWALWLALLAGAASAARRAAASSRCVAPGAV